MLKGDRDVSSSDETVCNTKQMFRPFFLPDY